MSNIKFLYVGNSSFLNTSYNFKKFLNKSGGFKSIKSTQISTKLQRKFKKIVKHIFILNLYSPFIYFI